MKTRCIRTTAILIMSMCLIQLFPLTALPVQQNPEVKELNQKNIHFVFLNGLGTHCDGTRYSNMAFADIRRALLGVGYYLYDPRFLMYSYTGGEVLGDKWYPRKYTPRDTGQPIQLSVKRLEYMIEQHSIAHPEAKYILIGHSLGGRVALDFVTHNQEQYGEKIIAVITLNSPLVGSGQRIPGDLLSQIDTEGDRWSSPAVRHLLWESEYYSELVRMRRQTVKELQRQGLRVATFSTSEDIIVDAMVGCITDEHGRPVTDGMIVDVGGSSIRDISGHRQILAHEDVTRYIISMYLDIIFKT